MCCGWGEREFAWCDGGPVRSQRGAGGVLGSKDGSMIGRVTLYGLLSLSFCLLFSLTLAAPTLVEDGEVPLIRVKRTDEVSYGNLQNEPRIKKSDEKGDDPLDNSLTDHEDKEITNKNENKQEIPENEEEFTQGEKENEKEEQAIVPEEPSEATKEDRGGSRESQMDWGDKQGDEDVSSSDEESVIGSQVDDSEIPSTDHRAISEHKPMKRSISMMIAENMPGKSQHVIRSKRDLGYDELRELLANQGLESFDQSRDYYEEPEGENDPELMYDYRDVADAGGDEESLLEEVASRKDEALQKEILRAEVVRRLLLEKEEEQEKEVVLDYLIDAAEERLGEAVEEEQEAEFVEKEAKKKKVPTATLR